MELRVHLLSAQSTSLFPAELFPVVCYGDAVRRYAAVHMQNTCSCRTHFCIST